MTGEQTQTENNCDGNSAVQVDVLIMII